MVTSIRIGRWVSVIIIAYIAGLYSEAVHKRVHDLKVADAYATLSGASTGNWFLLGVVHTGNERDPRISIWMDESNRKLVFKKSDTMVASVIDDSGSSDLVFNMFDSRGAFVAIDPNRTLSIFTTPADISGVRDSFVGLAWSGVPSYRLERSVTGEIVKQDVKCTYGTGVPWVARGRFFFGE